MELTLKETNTLVVMINSATMRVVEAEQILTLRKKLMDYQKELEDKEKVKEVKE